MEQTTPLKSALLDRVSRLAWQVEVELRRIMFYFSGSSGSELSDGFYSDLLRSQHYAFSTK